MERADSLFQRMASDFVESTSVDSSLPRPALFEVVAGVDDGRLRFNIECNRNRHEEQHIQAWAHEFHVVLVRLSEILPNGAPTVTPGDFSLVSVNGSALDQVLHKTRLLAHLHSFDAIEDIYPCTGIQEGMLVSQLRSPGQYATNVIWEVGAGTEGVDVGRLGQAWQDVVARHSILRSFFVDSAVTDGSLLSQVVLKSVDADVTELPPQSSFQQALSKIHMLSDAGLLERSSTTSHVSLPHQPTQSEDYLSTRPQPYDLGRHFHSTNLGTAFLCVRRPD